MVWRSVVISQPAKLKREHFSLVIEQAQSARVPFEDIAVIVLNNREITITHPVLSACAEYGVALYSTGDNHQPNGVFLPFLSHSRVTRMMRLQLDIDKPQTKRAWAEVVKVKISNQALCLKLAKKGDFGRLESYASRVRSGDTEKVIAPTINLDVADENCDLDYTPNVAKENAEVKVALCNCIGFGSKNSALVLRKS